MHYTSITTRIIQQPMRNEVRISNIPDNKHMRKPKIVNKYTEWEKADVKKNKHSTNKNIAVLV